MSEIELDSLGKRFSDKITAVDDVSLSIEDGEFITLVGPSGCGKTTTLRMIAGFESPTSGNIYIGSDKVTNRPPYNRGTGMVFQQFALFPHMTVGENIAYGLKNTTSYASEEIDSRVDEMLDLVQLSGMNDRNPSEISGGQQQRIALARAIAPQPEVLLLDEPLASLDKKLREDMQIELRQIQQNIGITTIFVTHNQEEALTMSDRIVVMFDGQFEQIGAPETVYQNPKSQTVADFIGTSNILNGKVIQMENQKIGVDCGVSELFIDNDTSATIGDDVYIVIRPESAFIEKISDSSPEEEILKSQLSTGQVTFRRYLGSNVEYEIEMKNKKIFTVYEQRGPTVFSQGDRVRIEIDLSDVKLLEE